MVHIKKKKSLKRKGRKGGKAKSKGEETPSLPPQPSTYSHLESWA